MPEVSESDKTVKIIFLLLLPFFLCLIVYYTVEQIPPNEVSSQNVGALTFSKILIVTLLCVYVLTSCYAFQIELVFCILIAIGLLFSSVADGLQLFEGKIDNIYFYELILYGCSHFIYTVAFGFKPLNPIVGTLTALPFVGVLMVLIPRMSSPSEYYISIYTVINIVLVWRVIMRVSQQNGPLKMSVVMMTTGVASLVISDAVLMYDKFHSKITFSSMIIPLTYYTGQLGIASSIFHLPHKLRAPNPYFHVSGEELCDQFCAGCPFP